MARPKTSVNRLDGLKKFFTDNKGRVLTPAQIEKNVGASYWRACVRDLKTSGLNIESVRDGRAVVGYKLVGAGSPGVAADKVVATAKAKTKPVANKSEAVAVPASKTKKVAKPAKGKKVKVKVAAEDVVEGAEDPKLMAILSMAGL